MTLIPVILSGGSGTRLWPLSRTQSPKQYLKLLSDHSFFQETILRLQAIGVNENPLIICGSDHRFTVLEHLSAIETQASHILLEPEGRNTAPAIAAAAYAATKDHDDPILFILPADHVIENTEIFKAAVTRATALANDGYLVTFGITPDGPNTEYGYIKQGPTLGDGAAEVDSFTEKPNLSTAQQFIADGHYLFNGGMFMFKASTYLEALNQFEPGIATHAQQAITLASHDYGFTWLDQKAFSQCANISIDYAVMERANRIAVVVLDAGWCDIGSWKALWQLHQKDDHNNACIGDVMPQDSHHNYLYSHDRLLATLGVENLVVVNTHDATLVAHKDQVHHMRGIVQKLKDNERPEATLHHKVHRPWGWYQTIGNGARDLVKRISVKPGAKLSLQKHHHRAEHWVVVKGIATVIRDDQTLTICEDQSTYIPVQMVHSLANNTDQPLEIIEVQTGDTLSEDDIVRLEDKYGRASKNVSD